MDCPLGDREDEAKVAGLEREARKREGGKKRGDLRVKESWNGKRGARSEGEM